MVKQNFTMRFLVISDLFKRYTIVVSTFTDETSVYCEECEQWVARWEGEKLSAYSPEQLLGEIVEEHRTQVCGEHVSFDEPKPLSIADK
jgi:hypothetical protein